MAEKKNEIIVYQPNETVRIDVRLQDETVWLTQEQMSLLFGRDQSVIARHIGNIYREGELEREAVYAKIAYTASDGKTYQVGCYNLDVVISVGYRVKSIQGTRFRQWANRVLKEYLLYGHAFNQRIRQLEDRVDHRLAMQDQNIMELKEKVDFFVKTSLPPVQGVFYDGQMWDARIFADKLVKSARKNILLIDNWATVETLDILAQKNTGVAVTVITSEHRDKANRPRLKITAADVAKFNSQYPNLNVVFRENFHDRFLVIDDAELYLIGASLKDLGKKCFAFNKLDAAEIPGLKARI